MLSDLGLPAVALFVGLLASRELLVAWGKAPRMVIKGIEVAAAPLLLIFAYDAIRTGLGG